MPWVYFLFGVAEVLSSSVLYTTFISSQKPSVVPGSGPGTSNDTKNLPDVRMALVR